jgi:hypothetical protein
MNISLQWGLCPQTPGILRFRQDSWARERDPCPPPRNPGNWIGARVPSLESPILRSAGSRLSGLWCVEMDTIEASRWRDKCQ